MYKKEAFWKNDFLSTFYTFPQKVVKVKVLEEALGNIFGFSIYFGDEVKPYKIAFSHIWIGKFGNTFLSSFYTFPKKVIKDKIVAQNFF